MFGGFVQVLKEIAVALDILLHPFGRRDGAASACAFVFGQIGRSAPIDETAIEAQHRFGGAWRIVRSVHDLLARYAEVAEQRVGEDFAQVRYARAFGIGNEGDRTSTRLKSSH